MQGMAVGLDYGACLNDQQYAAVSVSGADGSLNCGPVLVIAGAGSGKTRTLTYRVAWLMEHGVAPWRILLVTFTNKAAREMLRRVGELVRVDNSAIWGGTFHHVANRILRRHAALIGYGSDFSILDRDDSRHLLDACLAEAGIDPKHERFPKADVLAEIYSLAVNTGQTIERVVAGQYPYFSHLTGPIRTLQAVYAGRKQKANAMDYDDLLVNALRLLRESQEARERYQEQFLHVLVDEYQDTNRLQAEFIDLLAGRHGNLMVVGDDAQSIYSWRGADTRNILSFPDRHPGARVFKIEVNYRSVPGILTLANDVIRAAAHQFEKTLRPVRGGGAKPRLVSCEDSNHQAEFVAQRIAELRAAGAVLGEIAVLYRAHYHAMELQMELTRSAIPFVITSGLRFFEQAHIKDVSCFLKVAINPQDETAFKRIMRLLSGVGERTADKLWSAMSPRFSAANPLPDCCPSAPKKAAQDWRRVARVLNGLRFESAAHPPEEMIETVMEGFYDEYLKRRYPNARSRAEDLDQLAGFAAQYENATEFLSQLALLTNLEADQAALAEGDGQDSVRLSTVHQAKGLEWRVVFVIGLCDGMFPLARVLDEAAGGDGLAEERRLFYVSVTRAKDELYLVYPQYRSRAGFQRPSRFIEAVAAEHFETAPAYRGFGRW
jgi:DNA helicase-2/ATP-dependent DNA helicase PcrA